MNTWQYLVSVTKAQGHSLNCKIAYLTLILLLDILIYFKVHFSQCSFTFIHVSQFHVIGNSWLCAYKETNKSRLGMVFYIGSFKF